MGKELIWKGFKNPDKLLELAVILSRGYYYKLKYKLLRRNVRIGKKFKVKAGLSIKGPGKVIIGDYVFIDGTPQTVTPWTTNPEAEILIGNNVYLNGTRIGCARKVEIGNNCIIADCRIMDTDFHSTNPRKRNDPEYVQSSPVKIGNNVWITLGCVVLRGVTIGDNSTITAQSVVHDDVEENSIYGGNPAVLIKRVANE